MKAEIKELVRFLSEYDGEKMTIMEICGSHTSALSKSGLRTLISPKIKLISGPGCPVCVTSAAYIDKLVSLSENRQNVIVSFGDMLRVPGSKKSLSQAKGEGADVRMVYSPLDIIPMAEKEPDKCFIFAAVGFETTVPAYALLVNDIIDAEIKNVKLLTSVKMMPPIVDALCRENAEIDAFLAPGHVCAVTGSHIFENAASEYNIPFVVAGFKPEELAAALCMAIKKRGCGKVYNCYQNAVNESGNEEAERLVRRFFKKKDAYWRGMGSVKESGLVLKEEYEFLNAGKDDYETDTVKNTACRCGQVLMGRIKPVDCPLFGKICSPINPQGACMVSEEGACCAYYNQTR